jgi:hypothetical protein
VLLHFIQSSNESQSSARKQMEYDYLDTVSATTFQDVAGQYAKHLTKPKLDQFA